MNKFIKSILIIIGFIFIVLTSGCAANDEYYAESTYAGTIPMYDMNNQLIGNYYQSGYQVRGYWPTYARPYVQRQYYYVW